MFLLIGSILLLFLLFLLYLGGKALLSWGKSLFPRWTGRFFWPVFAGATFLLTAPFFAAFAGVGIWRPWLLLSRYGVGLFFYFILIFPLLSFVLFLVGKIGGAPISRRIRQWSGALALLLLLSVFLGGVWNGARVVTTDYRVTLGNTGREYRAAMVTDIHLGNLVGTQRLEEIAETIREISPQIVFLVGDLFDGSLSDLEDPDGVREVLLSLSAPLGVYAVPGNHDAGAEYGEMMDFLRSAGITVLRDEWVTVDDAFLLVGRRDASPIGGAESRMPVSVPEGLPLVVLDHQPWHWEEFSQRNALLLSGHTHRGQMFPLSLVTDAVYPEDYGYVCPEGGKLQAVISSGAGYWGTPLRVGSSCEVVDLTLCL